MIPARTSFYFLFVQYFPLMAQHIHQLKRLQHGTNTPEFRKPLSPDETARESSESFAISYDKNLNSSRSVLSFFTTYS